MPLYIMLPFFFPIRHFITCLHVLHADYFSHCPFVSIFFFKRSSRNQKIHIFCLVLV